MAILQIIIDEELKDEASKFFNDLGLDLSTAIRIYFKKCIDKKIIPFEINNIKYDENNAEKFVLKAHVNAPKNTSPYEIMNLFRNLCDDKGWYCEGGGVRFLSKSLTISRFDDEKYYYGSSNPIEYLKKGSDITPCKELAIAFSHKPSFVTIDGPNIFHDGEVKPSYLYIVDEPLVKDIDFTQHEDSAFHTGFELKVKRDIKLKLIDKLDE
ncbi:MAG: type II toxin-antitoxin system RelB/DinJ family antitoxin [Bacilli bacterium]|nr:type II toxin-antitoxin system RelB/DinJ family antitoxin [Bacilli bacterium]